MGGQNRARAPPPPPLSLAWLAFAVAATAPLLVAIDAHATVIRDGDRYVVHLRDDALVCFQTPPPAHPDPACEGLVAPPRPGKVTFAERLIAVATVRIPGGDTTAIATMTFLRLRRAFPMEPETEDLAPYAKELVSGFTKSLPGAHLHAAPSSELWKIDGLPVARFSVDLDDVPPDKERAQHVISFDVWADDGVYALSFTSRASDARAVDAFADESIASLKLAHRAPTRTYTTAYYGTQVALYVLVGGVTVVLVVRSLRKRRRNRDLIASGQLVMVPPKKKRKKKRRLVKPASAESDGPVIVSRCRVTTRHVESLASHCPDNKSSTHSRHDSPYRDGSRFARNTARSRDSSPTIWRSRSSFESRLLTTTTAMRARGRLSWKATLPTAELLTCT